jgi:autotransporter strand-loop-strand O-heptosyltransferase
MLKQKLLFITSHLSTGGLPQYLLTKIRKLSSSTDIHVVMWSDIAPLYNVQRKLIQKEIPPDNFHYWEQGTSDNIKSEELLKLIDSIQPDVIHMEEFPEMFLPLHIVSSIYSKENRQYKIVETSHNSSFSPSSKKFLPDAFVFVSQIQEERFRQFRVPITIVEYPIEQYERPNREEALKKLNLDTSYKHILNVGLFTPGKNQGEVFDIARRLIGSRIQFHFIGNTAPNFKEYWEPLVNNKPDNCIIHGERDDVDDWYAACDLLLFTSKSELNPLVPREALSWQMPVLMYNLPIYYGCFDDKVEYLEDNMKSNVDKILSLIYKPKLPNIRMVHLLTRPNDERELASVKSLSPLKSLGIDYKQHINEPCKVYPDDIPPISPHREKKPGYYGAYTSFRRAIEEEFTKDLDYFMICECDCVLNVSHNTFIRELSDICKTVGDNDIYYFSLGATGENGMIWSDELESIDDRSFITNKIILAHCILFPQRARNFLLKRMNEISWDSPDLWLNHVFAGHKKMGIIRKPLASQHEGESLIDNEMKGTVQTFDIDNNRDMLSLLMDVYNNTEIEYRDMLKTTNTYNVNFINGAFLEVLGDSDNTYYKNIDGWFNFDNIYHSMVNEFDNGSHFVEIGAWFGKSTCYMATEIKNSGKSITFDAIDTWKGTLTEPDHQKTVRATNVYDKFIENMSAAGVSNYVNPIVSDSLFASDLYEDNSLDFVFIDGDHTYEGVIADIKAWYPKVRDGGIIAGHDYMNQSGFGVIEAVNDMFGKNKLINNTSWLHRKNSDKPIKIHSDKYLLEAIDEKGNTVYSDELEPNHYIRCSRKWYTDWTLRVSRDGKELFSHTINLMGKPVYIAFDSSSLGDTLAWIPYVEEFRKKHNCIVYCSTWWNKLFQNSYPLIRFVQPGTTINGLYAMYTLYYSMPYNPAHNPINPVTIPLQRVASDILGLEFREIRPIIDVPETEITDKYVCFSMHSTAQCKYWNNPQGWQQVVNYLNTLGYKVINISKEKSNYMGNRHPKNTINHTGDKYNIEHRVKELLGASMYIGVSSGLAWLAWSLGIPTVLISGCTKPFNEPKNGIYRVHNTNVCNGCMNDASQLFDKGNWKWCPHNKNFECTRKISGDVVIQAINQIINLQEQSKWNNENMWSDDGNEWSKGFGDSDKLWNDFLKPRVARYLRGNVLEIAPGHGRLTNYISPLANNLTIVDMNESCIEHCRQRFSDRNNISYFVNDGKTLPVDDNSLDLIISWDSFVHMHRDVIDEYLKQAFMKLKEGGYGFIHHSLLQGGEEYSFHNIGGRSNMTDKTFKHLCSKHNMEVISQETVNMNDKINDCITIFQKPYKTDDEFRIVALTCMHNAEDYIAKCVNSIKCQSYKNFHCYIVDDCSDDDSIRKALRVINGDNRFSVISNETRHYLAYNYHNILNRSEIKDSDVIVIVDGDDYLPDSNVFHRVREAYADGNTLLTYGSFKQIRDGNIIDGWAKEKKSFQNIRNEMWSTTHLRTFKAFLFRLIKEEDLKDDDGNFFESCIDTATMFPMLEMAGTHRVKFLVDTNYIYNDDNDSNIYKINRPKQVEIDKYIRSKKSYAEI